jgi:signal transduction histidine kinase
MQRVKLTWVLFGACLAVVLAAMGWVSLTVLRLEKAELRARRQAEIEENVRLSLWRMDSQVALLVHRESDHPYFAYKAFYPEERAYTRMFAEVKEAEVLVPSPLLSGPGPHVSLYFHFRPDGELTSPQVPVGNMRDLAEESFVSQEAIEAAAGRLERLRSFASRDALIEMLPPPESPVVASVLRLEGEVLPDAQYAGPARQSARNDAEWSARRKVSEDAQLLQTAGKQRGGAPLQTSPAVDCRTDLDRPTVQEGVMKPLWLGEELVLARRVRVKDEEHVQGSWLDWPALQRALLEDIGTLLPQAELLPVVEADCPRAARRLSALPVRLEPGEVPEDPTPTASPVPLTLSLAWGCVLVAALAVAGLLRGVVALSERRRGFVSAVTHELRTPLTTFRMYSEMLASGMIEDEAKRRAYLGRLCEESDRLGHLVENVLSYARLENGRPRHDLKAMTLRELRDRVGERLRERAAKAGLELVFEGSDPDWDAEVVLDVGAVEQILANLVDNASKYAAGAADHRLHFEARRSGHSVALCLRDHGPGVAADVARRLFRPFSKSAIEAAASAPGVGLGLALSRRFARDMGGELRLDASGEAGACFELRLPCSGSTACPSPAA